MPKDHHRRDGYWKYYHLAHSKELDSLTEDIVFLVERSKPPAEWLVKRTSNRGRKPVHSWCKLVCICLLMVILGLTFRDMQNLTPKLSLPWRGEPCPDHSTIHRAYQRIPKWYLDSMLDMTAKLCINEVGWRGGGVLAPDSTGVETDRYEEVVRPSKKKGGGFEKTKVLIYLKYHVVVILDYLIILRARVTSSRRGDSPTLRVMLRRFEAPPPGCVFDADKGYDAEANFKRIYKLEMKPNIKQRKMMDEKEGRGKGRKRLPNRSKAGKEFNQVLYRYRGMVEAIFGAEESDGHNLYTRFRKKENQRRWGITLAIGWNLKALNRLRCAKSLGIEVTSTIRN